MKSEESGLLEMIFKKRKTDSIPPIPKHLIKNGKVILLNYAPGHYCVMDSMKTLNNMESKNNKIIPFNLGMKKYITSKQRDIMNKAEAKRKKWEQYAPWVVLALTIIGSILFAAFLFVVGAKMEAANIAQRVIECGG